MSARRTSLLRCSAALSAAWLLNELGTNLFAFAGNLGRAKVLESLSDDLTPLAAGLGAQLLGMLAVTVAIMALVSLVWCAAARATWGALTGGAPAPRWQRWLFTAATTFAFFNAWYGLHGYAVPASRLALSPLSAFGGAVQWLEPASLGNRAVLLFSVPVVVTVLCVGLMRSRPLRRAVLAGVLLVTAAVQAGEAVHRAGPPRPFTAAGSVVLLGVDSLQLNRTAAGGHPAPVTPALDGFLDRALLFDNAWTPLARTYPSWLTLLSGRHPTAHGMRFNLLSDAHLDPRTRWLPQHFADAGHATLHATDEVRFSILRPRFGFQELLHPPMGAVDFLLGSFFDFSAANLARRTHTGHDLYPALAHNRATPGYDPRLFVDELITRLDRLPRDRPVFVTAHFCGNHWPFHTPAPWAHLTPDPVSNSIAMVDDQLGAVLRWMEAAELLPRATTVLLSDHGDGWSGDPRDDTNFHGDTVRDVSSNRIFFAFRGPGIAPGRRHERLRAEDLAPTLLERAGLFARGAPMDGSSFAAALAGGPVEPRPVFAESGLERQVYSVKQLVEDKVDWYRLDPLTGLVTLAEEGYGEFLPLKSYTLIDGGLRLAVTPHLRRVELHGFDGQRGVDRAEPPVVPPARARALIERLAARYALDLPALLDAAVFRGVLPATTPVAR